MATWRRSGCCSSPTALGVTRATKCLNQLRHLGFCGPDELRERFRGATVVALARDAAALRPNANGDPVMYATKLAMHTLGRRVVDIDGDCARLHGELADLVKATAPSLLDLPGVGVHTAALLLVAAGDNADRIAPRPPGHTSAGSPRSTPRPARRSVTGSTAAATGKPTTPCGGSCSPA